MNLKQPEKEMLYILKVNTGPQPKFEYGVVVTTVGELELELTFESIKKQTIPATEIIIVDDSIDQSVQLSYAEILKTGGGRGPSFSRNLGISRLQSDWVALADADDPWFLNKIEKQLLDIKARKLDFSLTSAIVNNRKRPEELLIPGVDPFLLLYGKKHLLWSKAYYPTGSFLFKVDKVGKFNTELTDRENLDFIHFAFKMGARIGQLSSAEIIVNFKPSKSLRRFDVNLEYLWFKNLALINRSYARNFMFESFRNVFRAGDYKKFFKWIFIFLSKEIFQNMNAKR